MTVKSGVERQRQKKKNKHCLRRNARIVKQGTSGSLYISQRRMQKRQRKIKHQNNGEKGERRRHCEEKEQKNGGRE